MIPRPHNMSANHHSGTLGTTMIASDSRSQDLEASSTATRPAGTGSVAPIGQSHPHMAFEAGEPWPASPTLSTTRLVSSRPAAEALVTRFHLTPTEAEVALLLAQRNSNREIAHVQRITEHTARRHTERVLRKLGLHGRGAVRDIVRSILGSELGEMTREN